MRPEPSPSAAAILAANRAVHAREASVYDQIHHEIFNRQEQARLRAEIKGIRAGQPPMPGRGQSTWEQARAMLAIRLAHAGPAALALDLFEPMCGRLRQEAAAD